MKDKIDAVVFDIGGVILKVNWNASIKQMGIPMTAAEAFNKVSNWHPFHEFECGRITEESFLKELNSFLNTNVSLDCFQHGWNACFTGIVPGVEEIIKRLSNQTKTYALSNTNITHYNAFISFPVFSLLDEIYTSFNLGKRKPDKAIFQLLLKNISIPADKILFIDDLKENLEAAQSLGIHAEQCLDSSKRLEDILQKYQLI